MINPDVRLVTVVGPTASGKTALALDLAEQFGGEIVCADSRTVYRELDIGAAKPTASERARVPHHLLDVVSPGEDFSAGEFKRQADVAINDIWQRARVPFLVGGSGLYVDVVIYEYEFPAPTDPHRRAQLEALSDDGLRRRLSETDPEAAVVVDLANRRRVIRAIETAGQPRSRRSQLRPNTLVLGLDPGREVLRRRIRERIQTMVAAGFLDEVRQLGERYGLDCPAFAVIGYRAFKDVVFGSKTMEQGVADFERGDELLMKKQQTWFKRHPEIKWIDGADQARELVREFLAR